MNIEDCKIVVIDDEPGIRRSLSVYLEDEGAEVLVADSGISALDIPDIAEVDVAIVDMRMPEMRGDELIPLLHEKNSETKFIIYTGSHEVELSKPLEKVGMKSGDIIYKPLLDLSLLTDKINELLNRD